MHLPCERQGVQNSAQVGYAPLEGDACQLRVQESHIERRIVDDEFGVADELQELPMHMRESRFFGQTLPRQPMHLNRAFIDLALRVQVLMEGPARQAAVEQLHATDFDDAVLLLNFEPRGFCIENDLPHSKIYRTANMRSIASLASLSTYSLPSCPECPFTQIH